MGSFGKRIDNQSDMLKESDPSYGVKLSERPNENGYYTIENFYGSVDELIEGLGCIRVEDALKKWNDKQDANSNKSLSGT